MEKNGLPHTPVEKIATTKDKTKQAAPTFKQTESDKIFDEVINTQKPSTTKVGK